MPTIQEVFLEPTAQDDGNGNLTATRHFRVTSDTIVHPHIVLQSPSEYPTLPKRYSPLVAGDPPYNMVCQSREGRYDAGDPRIVLVTCTYAPPSTTGQRDGTAEEDGIDFTPVIRFSTTSVEVPVSRAWSTLELSTAGVRDTAVVNSAGQPYDPPLMDVDDYLTISIEMIQKKINPALVAEYRNTVNLKALTIAGVAVAVNTGWLRNFEVSPFRTEEKTWYRCTYEIVVKPETWTAFVLDQGFYVLTGGNKLRALVDDEGQPVSEPRLLNGGGALLPDFHTPHFFSYYVKRAKDWKTLNLPAEGFESDEE